MTPEQSAKAKWASPTGSLAAELATARAALAQEVENGKRLRELLEQMLKVAENADETGYVTDCGFVDLDKLHAEVRAVIAAQAK